MTRSLLFPLCLMHASRSFPSQMSHGLRYSDPHMRSFATVGQYPYPSFTLVVSCAFLPPPESKHHAAPITHFGEEENELMHTIDYRDDDNDIFVPMPRVTFYVEEDTHVYAPSHQRRFGTLSHFCHPSDPVRHKSSSKPGLLRFSTRAIARKFSASRLLRKGIETPTKVHAIDLSGCW